MVVGTIIIPMPLLGGVTELCQWMSMCLVARRLQRRYSSVLFSCKRKSEERTQLHAK